jgi:hypothetical protein
MKKDYVKSLQDAVKEISLRLKENSKQIKENNAAYEAKRKSVRSFGLWNLTSNHNKELLEENNMLLEMQSQLLRYLAQYKVKLLASNITPDTIEYDAEELFELTISNEFTIDSNHPGLTDEDFTNRLLEYYEVNEEYENCRLILESRKQLISR